MFPGAQHGGRIGEQHTAYRRGLVLGLTMAEAGILIIFVLLLLIAVGALERQGHDLVPEARYEQLQSTEKTLASIKTALGVPQSTPPEEVQELVRAIHEQAASAEGQTHLRAAQTALAEIRRTEDEIRELVARVGDGSTGDAIADTVARQSRAIAMKEGQLQYAEQRLRALGQGVGARPCLVEDGNVVFLYDVVLTSAGIRMKLRDHARESPAVAGVELPAIDPAAVMTQEEFLAETRGLYDYGRRPEHQCRFHVFVYDGTEAAEKQRYKDLLQTVERHFYKQTTVPNGIPF